MQTQKLLKPPALQRNKPQSKKHRLFRVFHQILIHHSINNKLCFVFLMVEIFQFIHYTIHPMYVGLWVSEATPVIQKIFSFTTLEGIWNLSGFEAPLVFSSITLIFGLIVLFLIVHQVFKAPAFGNPNIVAIKIIMYYGVILRTFLFIPLVHASALCIFSENKNIKPDILPITSLVGVLNLLIAIGLCLMYSTLMVQISPFAERPFTGPINHIQLIKYSIKIFLGLFGVIMFKPDQINIIACGLIIISFGYIILKNYLSARNFVAPFNYLLEIMPLTIFWMALVSSIQQLASKEQNIGLIFTILGGLIFNIAYQWLKFNRQKRIIKLNYRNISKANQTIEYNYLAALAVKNYNDSNSVIFLQGILSYHTYNCRKGAGNCVCQSIKQKMINTNLQPDRPEIKQEIKNWFQFIKHNLVEVKGKYKNNAQITLLLALIEKDKLSNKFRALHCLQESSHFENGIKIEFQNYHLRRRIQESMAEEDRIQNQNKSVDINKFQDFQNKYFTLERMVQRSANDHLGFWATLRSDTVTKQKILQGGQKIFKGVQKITRQFTQISNINPNNLHCLILYSNFMKLIANSPEVYQKNSQAINTIKRNIRNVAKISNQSEKQKYGENSITGIIIISAERKNIGIIKHCSTKVNELLGFTAHQLISQNINTIMPKFIGNMHDDVLRNYLQISESKFDFIQRVAPIIDKNNFMSLCKILTKPLPNLLNGVQLIGIFAPIFQTHYAFPSQTPKYILYRSDSLQVQALSQSCFNQYGYKITKLDETQETSQDLNIGSLFDNSQEIEKATADKGIESNIIIKDYDGTVSQVPVVVHLRHQLFYFGVKIKLIYFFSSKKYNQILNSDGGSFKARNKIFQQQKEAQITLKQKESTVEQKRMQSKFLQEKIKIDFKPIVIKVLEKFGYAYLLLILIIASLYLFLDINSNYMIQNFKNTINIASLGVSRILQTNYYSRIMHLSMHYPVQLPHYSQYQQIHKRLSSSLQANQFELVKMELIAAQNGFSSESSQIQNFIINPAGQIQVKFSSLDDTIFDYITSASNYQSSPQKLLNFTLQLANNIPTPVTEPFANLFRLRYTGLFSAVKAKQNLLERLNTHYVNSIQKANENVLIRFLTVLSVILVIICFGVPFILSILGVTDAVIFLFSYLTKSDIEFQIKNCQIFLNIFYEDSYLVKLNKRSKTGTCKMIQRCSSYDADELKLNNKVRKGSAVVKYPTIHSDLDIKADRMKTMEMVSANKLQMMQRRFDQLSSKQLIDTSNDLKQAQGPSHKQISQDQEQQRNRDKLNSKNNYLKLIFIAIFVGFNLMASSYFISTFVYQSKSLEKSARNLSNYRLLLKNEYLLKAIKLYNLQAIIDNTKFMEKPLVSSFYQQYTTSFYAEQRQLNQLTYDSNSNSQEIIKDIYQYNSETLCSIIDQYSGLQNILPLSFYNKSQCEALQAGVLNQGLWPAGVAYSQLLAKLKNMSSLKTSVQSPQFQSALKLERYVDGTYLLFINQLSDQISQINSNRIQTLVITFAVSLTVKLLCFIIFWKFYAKTFKTRFIATLQMLKLIPNRIFQKNCNLDKQFADITKKMIQ